MTEAECNELVRKTGAQVGIGNAITAAFCKDVYRESEGDPYVVKVLVGEAADGKSVRRIERIVAGKDDLLDALFERTYKRLSPAAKRVFLILSNWRSLVAQIALDAALLRPTQLERIDVPATIDELRRVSFVDEHVSPADGTTFVSVPLVAGVFGRRKLSVSHEQSAIEDDTRFLRRFGAMQPADLNRGIEPRIQRFFASFSEDLSQNKIVLADEMPVLELIARGYSPAWLMIADLWRESSNPDAPSQVTEALTRYLEATGPGPHQRVAWERIGIVQRQRGDWAGFVNAQVQIAELPGSDLSLISSVVNTFNSVSHHLGPEERKLFAQRLARIMEPKITEGDATDCSRLAWLFLRCDNEDRAIEIVECGLKLDPFNEYCQNLKQKIWGRRAGHARDTGDWIGVVEASIRLAELPSSRFAELSEAANLFNQYSRDWAIGQDDRHRMALKISRLMEPRVQEGDATDCSRLAWILMYMGEDNRARTMVNLGLQKSPDNEHCLRLRARLD
jgi:hypothetical protein